MAAQLLRQDVSALKAYKKRVMALGSFDGFHLGHLELVKRLQAEKEKDAETCTIVSSFYPHPRKILDPNFKQAGLSSLRDDLQILSSWGVDYLLMIKFNKELAAVSADDFLHNYIVGELGVDLMIIGEDAGIGNNREGDAAYIKTEFEKLGLGAVICPFVQQDQVKISSGDIRDAVIKGDCHRAGTLLGRPYRVTSRIRSDSKRGGLLGFPTANQSPSRIVWPQNGVYITRTLIDGQVFRSATNVGVRPTFEGSTRLIETHVLTEEPLDLYKQVISVDFLERIRDEIRFDSPEQLKAQIESDLNSARNFVEDKSWM